MAHQLILLIIKAHFLCVNSNNGHVHVWLYYHHTTSLLLWTSFGLLLLSHADEQCLRQLVSLVTSGW